VGDERFDKERVRFRKEERGEERGEESGMLEREVDRECVFALSSPLASNVDESGIESVSTGLGVAISLDPVKIDGTGLACGEKGPDAPIDNCVENGRAGT